MSISLRAHRVLSSPPHPFFLLKSWQGRFTCHPLTARGTPNVLSSGNKTSQAREKKRMYNENRKKSWERVCSCVLKLVFQADLLRYIIYGDWTTWRLCTTGSKGTGNGSPKSCTYLRDSGCFGCVRECAKHTYTHPLDSQPYFVCRPILL